MPVCKQGALGEASFLLKPEVFLRKPEVLQRSCPRLKFDCPMLAAEQWPLGLAIVNFIASSAVTAVVGTGMARLADRFADLTGLGEAVFGAVLLGASSSISGILVKVKVAFAGKADLAVSNAVGGSAVQTVFLVVADLFHRRATREHAATSVPKLINIGRHRGVRGRTLGHRVGTYHRHVRDIGRVLVDIDARIDLSRAPRRCEYRLRESACPGVLLHRFWRHRLDRRWLNGIEAQGASHCLTLSLDQEFICRTASIRSRHHRLSNRCCSQGATAGASNAQTGCRQR